MIPRLALLLSLCALGQAASTGTHIVDSWLDGSGNPLSGTLSLTWPSFTTLAGQSVPAGSSTIAINNGVVNLTLQPTVGATSASTSAPVYTAVFYDPSGAVLTSQTWSVPVSSGALTLGDITCPGVTGCPTGAASGSSPPAGAGIATPTFSGIPVFTIGSNTSDAASATDIIGLFGAIASNFVFASPNASPGPPTFRPLASSDIPALNYQSVLSFTGTGSKTASVILPGVSGNCAKWDSLGNIADAGAPCGIGSGGSGTSGTVDAALAGQFAFYAAPGSTVAGHTLVASDIPALNYQAVLSFTGNGTRTASSTGALTTNDCAKWDANGNVVDAGAPCGSGSGSGLSAPSTTVTGNVPQYANITGTALAAGLGLVTAVGTPGLDTNLPSEKSVRTAINAALTASGNLPAQTGAAGYLVSNGTTVSWGNIATGGSDALDCATVPGVCDVATAVVPLKASANLMTGQNTVVGGPAVPLTNASITGTTQWSLVKLTGAPSTAVIAATSDTINIIGIAVAGTFGTAGTVYVQLSGYTMCAFDQPTTAGDWVRISSTIAGECHDSGSSTRPTSNQIIGRVLTTNAAAGTYPIILEQDAH